MASLIELKEKMKNIYCSHEVVLKGVFKFIATFLSLTLIKFNIGTEGFIDSWIVIIAISVVCALIPWAVTVIVLAVHMLLNVCSVSLELGILMLILMIIMFLLFFRFTPNQGMLLVLIPLAFFLKVPYAVPIIVGLTCSPVAVVSVVFGTVIYFMMHVISENSAVITHMSSGNVSAASINSILDMITGNKEMFLLIVAFVIATVVVYLIRRQSVDNAWSIAIIAGGILEFTVVLVGNLILKTDDSIVWIIVGTILSLLIAFIVQFFVFSLDYSRTEHTQFEDDEYYYYVKAVPKINVTAPDMNVKRINAQRRKKKPVRKANS